MIETAAAHEAPPAPMRLWELENPSDRYTFEAPDEEVAALAILPIGHGLYGAHTVDAGPELRVPIIAFSIRTDADFTAWWRNRFGRAVDESRQERLADVAQALDSFLCGDVGDRRAFAAVAGDGWREKREDWHDAKRTSLADIGARAWGLAAKFREELSR